VTGEYEGSSCLWHETDEGFYHQFTTKKVFVVKIYVEATFYIAVLLESRLW
jgi:hypothetical protein